MLVLVNLPARSLLPALLAALLLPSLAVAQAAEPCYGSGQYSVAAAEAAIAQGDALLRPISDCSGANLAICQQAEAFYYDAYNHLNQVIGQSIGTSCLKCDPSPLDDPTLSLQIRGFDFDRMGYPTTIGGIYATYRAIVDLPYCLPDQGGPLVRSCAPVEAWSGSLVYNRSIRVTSVDTYDECFHECETTNACLSFDYNEIDGICSLNDKNAYQEVVNVSDRDWMHYTCLGRR